MSLGKKTKQPRPPTPPKMVAGTRTVRAAGAVERGTKASGKMASNLIRKYPKTAALAGGYTLGVTHTAWAHSNPEFYDSTPNKGRSEDKHPYGGGY